MNYLGTYSDIFAAIEAYPNGATEDDFVIISDKMHRWNKRLGTWVTDTVDIPEGDPKPGITIFVDLTDTGILTDWCGRKWQLTPVTKTDDEDDEDEDEPTYYYGWAVTPATLNLMSAEDLVSYAKGSGNASQTLTENNKISNGNGQCVWLAYPDGKALTAVIKESGLTLTPTWLTVLPDKTIDDKTYHIAFAMIMTPEATIESLTYTDASNS